MAVVDEKFIELLSVDEASFNDEKMRKIKRKFTNRWDKMNNVKLFSAPNNCKDLQRCE